MNAPDPNLLFRQAAEACERGAFGEAAMLYRRLLEQIPGHPQILSALGNAEIALGEVEGGVTTLRRSLAIFESQPDAWCNLARGLRLQQQPHKALAAADRAIALAPDLFEAWTCRGNILWDLEEDGALAAYAKAAALRPLDPRAHFNHANALAKAERTEAAVTSFERALALAPDYVDAGRNLAILLCDNRRAAEALPVLERMVRPDDGELLGLYGMALHAVGRFDDAAVPLERAVALDPSSPVAVSNRGVNDHARGRLEAALADFERAMALDPAYTDAVVNRGTLLRDMGRTADAAAAYDAALTIDPNHPEANWNKGLVALLRGDFAEGWRRYDGRWQSKVQAGTYLDTPRPQWRGEDIAGKTIFIWQEQGYGDFIQFCRYVPLVAARGARVVLQVPERLHPLIATLKGPFEMVAGDTVPAAFDVHCPLMSLPLAFATTLANIPAEVPYLAADSGRLGAFDATLGSGARVGLAWSANLAHIYSHTRHMPATFVAPLIDLPAAFHVLQKDFRPDDRAFLAQQPQMRPHADEQNDFADAAALIAAMDMVVTVDTVVAHLAGALGKPVWVMLPYAADWRWLEHRDDTPWYPTMRLFRQPAPGDWAGVVRSVKAALAEFLTPGSAPGRPG